MKIVKNTDIHDDLKITPIPNYRKQVWKRDKSYTIITNWAVLEVEKIFFGTEHKGKYSKRPFRCFNLLLKMFSPILKIFT